MRLEVLPDGSGPFHYQWRRDNLDLPGQTNSVLLVNRARMADSGNYSVHVSSPWGEVVTSNALVTVVQVTAWGNSFLAPTNVPPGLSGVVRLAAGSYHCLALKDNGTVVAWGADQLSSGGLDCGQCNVPANLTNVVSIAAGSMHSLALKADGTVVAWGAGVTTSYSAPELGQSAVPPGLRDVVDIAAGTFSSFAVTKDGRIVAWGAVDALPWFVTNIVAVSPDGIALRGDGRVACWSHTNLITEVSNFVFIAGEVAVTSDGIGYGFYEYAYPWGFPYSYPEIAAAVGGGHYVERTQEGRILDYPIADGPLTNVTSTIAVGAGPDYGLAAFGEGSAIITISPRHRSVVLGTPTLLTVTAAGDSPLSYQWQFNATNLPGETNAWLKLAATRASDAGEYRVIVANALNAVTSAIARLELHLPLGPSLNAPQLSWSSGPGSPWTGEAEVTHDGVAAARSGYVTNDQQCSLIAYVNGPGTLGFWWKISSEPGHDCLKFLVDGITWSQISGERDWEFTNFSIPDGWHRLQWSYAKDAAGTSGADAGWLDEVTYVPEPPVIILQPQGGTITRGQSYTFLTVAIGPAPLSYQWSKDGTNIGGAISDSLCLPNPTRVDSGAYVVTVSGPGGVAASAPALLRVLVAQRLMAPARLPDGTFTLLSADEDGGALRPGDLAGFEGQTSTNLLDWISIPRPLQLTNGMLYLMDQQASNYQARFYRVLEH